MFDSAIFDFTDAEIREAAAANRLLSIEIEFNRLCNYRCPYCYAGDPETELPEMSSELADSVIRQAAELGARKVVILGGEPLLYPELERKIELVNFLGMGAEIFTNGALLDKAAARMFAAHNCRVVVKLNSLDPAVQARMTGEPEALELAQRALRLLREAGCGAGRVAASSVICSENVDGMPALWRYLREREILPYFEMMTPQGRMLENRHLMVEPARLRQVFEEIAAIDAQFGFCWEP
uniref:radical SAM protein n=1 Tax=Victivallis vadensis TaxID=172901 RepID=UPI003AF909DC